MVRLAMADVMRNANTVEAQAHTLHERLAAWSTVLFAGGEVEEALASKNPRWKAGSVAWRRSADEGIGGSTTERAARACICRRIFRQGN